LSLFPLELPKIEKKKERRMNITETMECVIKSIKILITTICIYNEPVRTNSISIACTQM
jgi:hypothetical protein